MVSLGQHRLRQGNPAKAKLTLNQKRTKMSYTYVDPQAQVFSAEATAFCAMAPLNRLVATIPPAPQGRANPLSPCVLSDQPAQAGSTQETPLGEIFTSDLSGLQTKIDELSDRPDASQATPVVQSSPPARPVEGGQSFHDASSGATREYQPWKQ